MPRQMSTAMLAAIAARELSLALFCEANFASGPVYIWSGLGPITWNGQAWTGLGAMGGISAIDEGSTVEARGITLTLSGFDSTLLPLVMNEFALLQPVTVWLGLFNEGSLIVDPLVGFAGRMDATELNIAGETGSIAIQCESVLLDLNVAVNRRYTADDQQRDWPGDLGMTFVNPIQEKSLYWGTAPTSTNNL